MPCKVRGEFCIKGANRDEKTKTITGNDTGCFGSCYVCRMWSKQDVYKRQQFEWYRDNDYITASEVFLRRFFYYKQAGFAQNSDPVHTQVERWQMLSTSIEF